MSWAQQKIMPTILANGSLENSKNDPDRTDILRPLCEGHLHPINVVLNFTHVMTRAQVGHAEIEIMLSKDWTMKYEREFILPWGSSPDCLMLP